MRSFYRLAPLGCVVALTACAPKCAPEKPQAAPQSTHGQEQTEAAPAPTSAKAPPAPEKPAASTAQATAKPDWQAAAPAMVVRSREMMGTIMQITVLGEESAETEAAIDAAFAEMKRLETVLSEWIDDSEISRINQQAGIAPVEVSEDALAVVRAGLEVSRWSEGAFDLSWAALRGLYLFQPGDENVPTQGQLNERLPLVNYKDIELDEKKKTVFLRRKGMKIGTGGIGKGYALDRAGQVLQSAGYHNYMLFGGGQVQVLGLKGDRPWRVGIQHPRKNDYFSFLQVDGGSISTSGDYEHAFIKDGRRWHHLLDLKTGLPVSHTMSVTVLADSGLYADAMSTAIFALGPQKAAERLASAPGNARFVLVDENLQVHVGGDLRDKLVFSVELLEGNKLN